MTDRSGNPPPSGRGLGRRFAAYGRVWGGMGVTLGADQATKFWAHHNPRLPHGLYPPDGGIDLIPGYLGFAFNTNTGAAWGILAGHGEWLALFAVIALLALYHFRRAMDCHLPRIQVAMGLLVGGILGNMIDRVWHGYVIDFIDVHLQIYRWPTFNLADTAIFLGVAIHLYHSFRHSPPVSPGEDS